MTGKTVTRRKKQEVEELLRRFPGVVLLGQRQVGKTTMAKEIAAEQDADYLDMGEPATVQMLSEQGLRGYIEQSGKQLTVLDEIQMRRDLFNELRAIIDRKRSPGAGNGSLLLLGSASLALANKSHETLTGRVDYVDLDPIDILEISTPDEIDKLWLRGGLPEAFIPDNDEAGFQAHRALISNLIKQELFEQGLHIAPEKTHQLLQLLAKTHGGILNVMEIASIVNLDWRVVDKCIGLLCNLLVVRKLHAYSSEDGKNLRKRPKIYYRDSGILHHLLELKSLAAIHNYSRVGLSWESFAIENILRYVGDLFYPSYYRTRSGLEVDLILKSVIRGTWAIEIKKGIPDASSGLHRSLMHIKPDRAFIVHGRWGMPRCQSKQGVESLSLLEMCREIAKCHAEK